MIFKKILLFAMFATAAGFCFADGEPCNGVAEYDQFGQVIANPDCDPQLVAMTANTPVWPAVGSDADIQISNTVQGLASVGNVRKNDDNIQIVSRIGADLVVENNINMGTGGMEFSGGANMLHPYQAPAGFNNYEGQAEMPLMHSEMLEDDGGEVLAMARSPRQAIYNNINLGNNGYNNNRGGVILDGREWNGGSNCVGGGCANGDGGFGEFDGEIYEVEVDDRFDEAGAPAGIQDQVRSWVVASGQTLRGVLQDWCDKEGWDLVWGTPREYPIEASAVFKGRFTDVASALVRNFGRATPTPYAKFYKGNRVLVITTVEGN